ncbi:MAG: ATP-dependent DNA helicase RecG [Gammaproteobacteria bacterium]|nr:ATP-dependent DNA helicase RecG [Gammaproteobacteria bacterium]
MITDPKPAARRLARPPLSLQSSVQYLRGAGPALAARVRALGLMQVQDLLFHLPLRYEDRRRFTPLAALADDGEALIRARVEHTEVRYTPRRNLRVALRDPGSGSGTGPGAGGNHWLLLRFFYFNEAQAKAFAPGAWVRAYGPVRQGASGLEMIHPEYRLAADPAELVPEAALTPVYPAAAGVTQTRLRGLIQQALDLAAGDPAFGAALPGLPGPETLAALRLIHQPQGDADAARLLAGTHPAQQRLIREELLAHQLCMRVLRRQVRTRPAPALRGAAAAAKELEGALPFRYTGAQQRVLAEVARDLDGATPMLRLVQGDVGSGKTVVAAAAMLAAARAGQQSALMAPTELLAEQHALNLTRWLEPLGIATCLLTGSQKKAQRELAHKAIADGRAQVVIGTHAVFQESVRFARLALVVIDEQHRFGVQQRLALRDKGPDGSSPHQLVMTATPIPRTLAQTIYADLDVSVIDELPPGRKPVTTVAVSNERRPEVLARIGAACAQGRQAYWVCTLIEESDQLEAQAAEETARQLRAELPQLNVGLVHGRLTPVEKDAQMQAFKNGQTQLLVATTVIEVGVDVPNASIMIVDNAERLGLAQLHQLRGRVGRGAVESQCVLMYQPPLSDAARHRLEVMRTTQDGFKIAQCDLELRGPGEILGRRQTGLIGLKMADPVRDSALIPPLQALADDWLQQHPPLAAALIRRWVGDVEKYGQV